MKFFIRLPKGLVLSWGMPVEPEEREVISFFGFLLTRDETEEEREEREEAELEAQWEYAESNRYTQWSL
jgi:hypothetical protein